MLGCFWTSPGKKDSKKEENLHFRFFSFSISRGICICIHKLINGMSFKKDTLYVFKEIYKVVVKKLGTCLNIRVNKATWAEGIGNVPYFLSLRC
uniref:Uncharacterized protein n=1 Tax=Dromaius novaehollandiae TaxID=8790 RepID=A0A8C4JQU1_DRONO